VHRPKSFRQGWRQCARCGNSRCFPRELFQGHSYKERRSNTKPVQKDQAATNAFLSKINRTPPQGKKEERPCSSFMHSTENRTFRGLPIKISMRMRHHATLKTYGSRFQVVALSYGLDETAASRVLLTKKKVGHLRNKILQFSHLVEKSCHLLISRERSIFRILSS